MLQVTTRLPVLAVENLLVTASLGKPNPPAELGDAITVTAPDEQRVFPNHVLLAADVFPLEAIPHPVLELFGTRTVPEFARLLERAYGTGLPASATITVYTFAEELIDAGESLADFPDDEIVDTDDGL